MSGYGLTQAHISYDLRLVCSGELGHSSKTGGSNTHQATAGAPKQAWLATCSPEHQTASTESPVKHEFTNTEGSRLWKWSEGHHQWGTRLWTWNNSSPCRKGGLVIFAFSFFFKHTPAFVFKTIPRMNTPFTKRRALQQGDIVKIDIPPLNKISNPSVQNYCVRHPFCIHTHNENSQIITTAQYIIILFHIWFTQNIYKFSWFSLPKELKKG